MFLPYPAFQKTLMGHGEAAIGGGIAFVETEAEEKDLCVLAGLIFQGAMKGQKITNSCAILAKSRLTTALTHKIADSIWAKKWGGLGPPQKIQDKERLLRTT